MKKKLLLIPLLSIVMGLTSCNGTSNITSGGSNLDGSNQDSSSVISGADTNTNRDDFDTSYKGERITSSDISSIDSNNVLPEDVTSIDLSTYTEDVTIKTEGSYVLSGTLTNHKVLVQVDGQVHLYLNNVSIVSDDGSAIAIFGKKKKVITLLDGTINTLTDNSTYSVFYNDDKDEPNAGLFAEKALTINGTGTLNIFANGSFLGLDDDGNSETKYAMGINCKDELKFLDNPIINITAVGNGIKGKNFVEIYDGTYTINSGNDGIKSDSERDVATLGYIYIKNGNFIINSADDGLSSYGNLEIIDGSFNITTGGGAQNAAKRTEYTGSYKGIKNELGNLLLLGGDININSLHDGLHSANYLAIDGTNLTINCSAATSESNDGKIYVHGHGLHSDNEVYIFSGSLNITESFEGIEGNKIYLNGGTIKLSSSDDGINASSETGDDASCLLTINDGEVYVNALGDGLDSNGNILMTGGFVVVDGPLSNGDGALDFGDNNNYMKVTGGTLCCIASNGMVENPSSNSTQVFSSFSISASLAPNNTISIYQGDTKLFSFETLKARNSTIVIQVSDAKLVNNVTYTCKYNDSSTTFVGGSVVSSFGPGGQGGPGIGGPGIGGRP